MAVPAVAELELVEDPPAAAALLDPRKAAILAAAREPASATEIGRRLGLPRQRVHYHVRELERVGLLRAAGRRRRRNLVEQRFVATSRAYALSPALLGPLAPDWRAIADAASPAYLLALADQVRSDLAGSMEDGGAAPTMSLKAQFRLDSEGQRVAFAGALREALVTAIARHTSPDRADEASSGRGRTYRLVLACYPVSAPRRERG
jgi:DNA-binding transcriptional ArsR family regulator